MDRKEARKYFTGPIPSICTPFERNGEIDFDSVSNIIERNIEAGAKAIILTAGDSHYDCLSDEEIIQLTQFTCEKVRDRAVVVAADRYHATARAIEFARIARKIGADIVMCMPPDWANSCTPQTMAKHFVEVSKQLPVMIVTNRFMRRGAEFGLQTVSTALEDSEAVVAVKDDIGGAFARRLCLSAYGNCAIIAGGDKQWFLNMWPFGCDGYISLFITYLPSVANTFWDAVQEWDMETIRRIISEIEIPYWELISSFPGGFDSGLHGTLEVFGLAKRWRREPYYSLNNEELMQLKQFLIEKNLLSSRSESERKIPVDIKNNSK